MIFKLQVFSSKEDLITLAREIGNDLGYVIVIIAYEPQNSSREARL